LVTSPQNAEELSVNKEKLDAVFLQLMIETVKSWVNIAEERLKGTGVKCYIMPGNDDRPEIGELLNGLSPQILNPEGKVVKIDDGHEMISLGFSNITPWNAPRDIPEEELAQRLQQMSALVVDMKNCLFNVHCPPFDSGLDSAPRLDKDRTPSMDSQFIPVGSQAVREAIEKCQPLLGLHGHIHESRGIRKIGRTVCINPGSEYSEGYLRGALVVVDDKKVKAFMLTSG
jgi:Icc-related predicted phosphoesterase